MLSSSSEPSWLSARVSSYLPHELSSGPGKKNSVQEKKAGVTLQPSSCFREFQERWMHQVGDKQESKVPWYLRGELTKQSLPHTCLHPSPQVPGISWLTSAGVRGGLSSLRVLLILSVGILSLLNPCQQLRFGNGSVCTQKEDEDFFPCPGGRAICSLCPPTFLCWETNERGLGSCSHPLPCSPRVGPGCRSTLCSGEEHLPACSVRRTARKGIQAYLQALLSSPLR